MNLDNKICDIIANIDSPWVSFEFFPPKTEKGIESLRKTILELRRYNPVFLDFTWGAGGSTSELTLQLCLQAQRDFNCIANMHLTCTNMDASKIDVALQACHDAGMCNVLALRGDPPLGCDTWVANTTGFDCALDLCNYIRDKYGDYFCVSVAGYPEGHPAAMTELSFDQLNTLSTTELQRYSIDDKIIKDDNNNEYNKRIINICLDTNYKTELNYLKSKIEAGAKFIVTQMFFDVEVYGIFIKNCRNCGINVPIVPGIMCIANYGGFKRMIKFCKTRVPEELLNKIEELKDDIEGIKQFGIEFGIKMCQRLKELGAPGFHFYTLNTSAVTIAILEGLGFHSNNEIENTNELIAIPAYA